MNPLLSLAGQLPLYHTGESGNLTYTRWQRNQLLQTTSHFRLEIRFFHNLSTPHIVLRLFGLLLQVLLPTALHLVETFLPFHSQATTGNVVEIMGLRGRGYGIVSNLPTKTWFSSSHELGASCRSCGSGLSWIV